MKLGSFRILSMVFLMLGPGVVFGQKPSGNLSADLAKVGPNTFVDVIVQFTKKPISADLDSVAKGGQFKGRLDLINGALFRLPAAALPALQKNPAIKFVTPDRIVRQHLEFANPTVNAPIALQYGWDGAGIGVAVIDSGVTAVPDLKTNCTTSRLVYSATFPNPGAGQPVTDLVTDAVTD